MTFAARTHQGSTQGGPVQFNPAVSNNSASQGIRGGSLILNNDGTTTQTVHGTNVAGGNWYAPAPTTGAGSTVWVKMVVTSNTGTSVTGSGYGTTLGTAPMMTVGGSSWTFTSTSSVQEGYGNFTLYFYGDSGGAGLLQTVAGSWDVGYLV